MGLRGPSWQRAGQNGYNSSTRVGDTMKADDGPVATSTTLRVRAGEASVTLRLEADPEGHRRALAHGLGHALSHVEDLPGPELREAVLGAGRAFAELGHEPVSTRAAAAALTRILCGLRPHLVVESRGTSRTPVRPPRWPVWLRTGRPRLDRGELWPVDVELVALRLGHRHLIKREAFDERAAEADEAWLRSQGLKVRRRGPADPDGRRVLFAAGDERLLHDALEAETAMRERRGKDALGWFGASLGYPQCCVAAYGALHTRDDAMLYERLLPRPPAAPASPLTQWVSQPLGLVSHAPCSIRCEATRASAADVLAAIEREHRGFERSWLELAQRIHAIDEEGRCWAIAFGEDGAIADAHELRAPPTRDPGALLRRAPELVGRALRLGDGGLTGALHAAIVADHRGAK